MPHRDPLLRFALGATVTFLWAVSIIVDMVNPAYDPPPGIHSLMLVVAGGIFGREVVTASRKDHRQ